MEYLTGQMVKSDLQLGIEHGKSVYFQRIMGLTFLWSATTRCVKCGEWWMWGVKNNLDYTCSNCK